MFMKDTKRIDIDFNLKNLDRSIILYWIKDLRVAWNVLGDPKYWHWHIQMTAQHTNK
jgi:hypothetical protein